MHYVSDAGAGSNMPHLPVWAGTSPHPEAEGTTLCATLTAARSTAQGHPAARRTVQSLSAGIRRKQAPCQVFKRRQHNSFSGVPRAGSNSGS